MHNPPDPTMQPRGFSPDLRVMVGGAQRERKSSIKCSLFGKKMYESLKKKLQLNSFFWYNHRVSESSGVQLKEGNSWHIRIWKSQHVTASWLKP